MPGWGLSVPFACLQVGAFMNESFQAKDGLPPDAFPELIPTYTGHYHKPHTVDGTSIRYVGSPYQGVFTVLFGKHCRTSGTVFGGHA
jgi:hypothetical protein